MLLSFFNFYTEQCWLCSQVKCHFLFLLYWLQHLTLGKIDHLVSSAALPSNAYLHSTVSILETGLAVTYYQSGVRERNVLIWKYFFKPVSNVSMQRALPCKIVPDRNMFCLWGGKNPCDRNARAASLFTFVSLATRLGSGWLAAIEMGVSKTVNSGWEDWNSRPIADWWHLMSQAAFIKMKLSSSRINTSESLISRRRTVTGCLSPTIAAFVGTVMRII